MATIESSYKAAILHGCPSLANYILRAIASTDDRIKTAATDGLHIFYNDDFVNGLTALEALAVFAHEYYHIVYDHVERGKTKPVVLSNDKGEKVSAYNLASDVIVNESVSKRLGLSMPDGAVERGKGMFKELPIEASTSNKIYDWLLENTPDMSQEEAQSAQEMEEGNRAAQEQGQQNDTESDALKEIAQNEEKSSGNLSEIKETGIAISYEVDWMELTDAIAIETGRHMHLKRLRSFQRPPRHETDGIFMRGSKTIRHKPSVALYVDVSGSMGDSPITIMAGLRTILNRLIFFRPSFYTFNTGIKKLDKGFEEIELGGGTDIKNVISHLKDDVNIIITDCEDNISREDFPQNAVIVSNNKLFADYFTTDWKTVRREKCKKN